MLGLQRYYGYCLIYYSVSRYTIYWNNIYSILNPTDASVAQASISTSEYYEYLESAYTIIQNDI